MPGIDRPPTPAMLEVRRKMANGLQMWHSAGICNGHWLGPFGPMRSQVRERFESDCAYGMFARGLIAWNFGFPWSTATLTAKGRELAGG